MEKTKVKSIAVAVGKFILVFVGSPVAFIIGAFPVQYFTPLLEDFLPEYIAIPIALSLPIFTAWLYIHLIWKKFDRRRITRLNGLLGLLFFLFIFPIALSVFFPFDGNTRERSRDAKRISDLKQLQLAIRLYADDNDSLFPPVSSSCSNAEILEEYLVPSFISRIPDDPINVSYSPSYQVAVSTDRKSYVFKARLERKRHNALGNDVDDNIMGCDCNDPNYCVGSENFSN